MQTARLRVMLTITLSELMSEVQVTQMKSDGTLEESGEARRLRKSLEEMADESKSPSLKECGLPEDALFAVPENFSENRWSWSEVKYLSDSLLLALDASLEHALLVSSNNFSVFTCDCFFFFFKLERGRGSGGCFLFWEFPICARFMLGFSDFICTVFVVAQVWEMVVSFLFSSKSCCAAWLFF